MLRYFCAAVADFRPEAIAEEKIKRVGDDLVLKLKPTQDIAANNRAYEGKESTHCCIRTGDE